MKISTAAIPPKKGKKAAPKKAELKPELHVPHERPASCGRTVPLERASDEGYNALLPWLAMALAP